MSEDFSKELCFQARTKTCSKKGGMEESWQGNGMTGRKLCEDRLSDPGGSSAAPSPRKERDLGLQSSTY